jgi:hypothetical protein
MTTKPQSEENTPESLPINPSRPPRLARPIGVIIILVIIGISLSLFATSQSLPGGALYGIKTNVLETVIGATHLRSTTKASYQVTLLEKRFAEAERLSLADTVSEKELDVLIKNTTAHWITLSSIASTSIDSAFPKTELLTTVNEFASVASAMEELTENDPKLTRVGDSMEDVRQDAVHLYRDRVESFVATETAETAYTYLTEQLQAVEQALSSVDFSTSTMRRSENYLDRIEPAVTSGNITKAILAVGETYRIITAATYLGKEYVETETQIEIPSSETSSSSPSTTTESTTTATTTIE